MTAVGRTFSGVDSYCGWRLRTLDESTAATEMTIDRMAQDGIDLAQYLLDHLHKDKIIVVGHSWGTILGIHMVKARPDLFYAYVGAGQVVNAQENEALNYTRVLGKAKALGDSKAVAEL